MIQWMLAIWSLVPLPFLNPIYTSESSQFTYCWSLAWRILSIILLGCEMITTIWQFEHSLALPFFGIGMKTDLFQSYGHCWVFQICWHIECSTLTASSFRILNSSAGIPSPPLGLLVVDTVCLQISFLLLAMLCMICKILIPWPGTEPVPSTMRSMESQLLFQISFFFLRTPGIRFRAHLTPVWCCYSHILTPWHQQGPHFQIRSHLEGQG